VWGTSRVSTFRHASGVRRCLGVVTAAMSLSDPNLQALALHQERVRALAWALLRDEHAAEDVVQDTWVRALERRPHELRSGGAWFSQVARRFALNRLRSDARRGSRERQVARLESVPSSAEIAARVELQRVLLDAVEALPEPWRATLRDHDLGDLSLAQIARRDGLAPVEELDEPPDVRELPPVIVRLGRGRTVTGTVVDELGRPVAGIDIHARHKHSEGVLGLSAVDGTFTLELLPDLELLVSTSADGWQDADVKVPAGSSGPLELRLTRAGRLHGRVVDAVSGAPLRAFTVRLIAPELEADEQPAMGYGIDWERGGVAFDAPDGRWNTGGESLTTGLLGVEVRATGYEPLVVARALVAFDEDAEELVHALHPVRR